MSDSLVDLLDRIVDTGVAATGDVTISLADVELISLRLQLLLDSIGTDDAPPLSFPSRSRARPTRTVRLDGDEDSLQRGLAQLVLVLVELLGELLERQALRRMAAGSLQDDEVRKLGNAFAALHRRLDELHEELLAAPAETKKGRPLAEPPLPAVR
ncbi:MAG TPA: gas vesicle protein GvpJ [Gaiellaceae bacterium]|nr:gas vesicle protein GvpJ [Gaiellaceae bacterium]